MMAAGQIALSLGLHPEHLASFRLLLQGGLSLVLGSVVIASGMLGLADSYERVAVRLHQLLGTKQSGQDLEVAVQTSADLIRQNRSFWKAYYKSALALCLFLGGILGLTIVLTEGGFLSYLVGLGLGIAFFGLLAASLSFTALRHMRRAHQTLEHSAGILDEQPDIADEFLAPEEPQPATRWVLRRSQNARTRQVKFHRRPSQVTVRRY